MSTQKKHWQSIKAIVVGSPTVGQNILFAVGGWIDFLHELKFKNKKSGIWRLWLERGIQKILREQLSGAGFSVAEPEVRCRWNTREENFSGAAAIQRRCVNNSL